MTSDQSGVLASVLCLRDADAYDLVHLPDPCRACRRHRLRTTFVSKRSAFVPSSTLTSPTRGFRYHCRPGRRAVNVTKVQLEGLFADELALLRPTPATCGYSWNPYCRSGRRAKQPRLRRSRPPSAAKAIQEGLNRLEEAFLFERSIDIETYDRHAEKLREELTLARIDRNSGQLDELDVEGILAFAERVLPRAANLWVQASLEQRQRFQQLFLPN